MVSIVRKVLSSLIHRVSRLMSILMDALLVIGPIQG